jgi:hypothetical protein
MIKTDKNVNLSLFKDEFFEFFNELFFDLANTKMQIFKGKKASD